MPFFERDDFKMHFEVVPGVVPADVLFIHGNIASNIWWKPTVELLREQSVGRHLSGSLILAEWRGCGKSRVDASPDLELDSALLAEDYRELLRFLGVTRAHVVGHSTGGLIALQALLDDPALFERALLLNPVSPDGCVIDPKTRATMLRMGENRSICEKVIHHTIHRNDRHSEFFQDLVDDAFGVSSFIWSAVPRMLERVRMGDLLSHIAHPTLVLHGEFDTVLPLEPSRELAKRLPSGKFELLENQGHSCNIENPSRLVRVLSEFFFGCSSRIKP